MEKDIDFMKDLPQELQMHVIDIISTNTALQNKVEELNKEICSLKNVCNEQKIQIQSDSSTSSKPPSTDWCSANTVGSLDKIMDGYHKEKFGDENIVKNKPGKQANSEGHGRKEPQNAEKNTIEHKPVQCLNCANCDSCTAESKCTATRKVIDIEIKVKLDTHKVISKQCPLKNGEKVSGLMPNGLNSTMQFGIMVQAICILLYILGLSFNRIHTFFTSIMKDAAPSVGTINNIVKKFGESSTLNMSYDRILSQLQEPGGVLHCDETGIRTKLKTLWLHVICTANITYLYAAASRSYNAMIAGGTSSLLGNILIHDCYKAYFKIEGVLHGLCNAHIVRELAGVVVFYKQKWAQKMIECLFDMYYAKKEAILNGKNKLSDDIIKKFKDNMRTLANEGIDENPLPEDQLGKKRPKRPKPLNLAMRILEHLDEITAFIVDFRIPFTNNIAERAVRSAKIKIKNSTYLTLEGAIIFAKIQSVLDTAKKQHISQMDAIQSILSGNELYFSYTA